NTAGVCQHEGAILNVLVKALDPPTGHCAGAGINQVYHPVGLITVMDGRLASSHIDCEVAVQGTVIHHVFLNDFAFIAEGDGEVFEIIVGIVHHNVPQNGLAADFNHWLGFDLGFFHQARAQPAREDDDFHTASPERRTNYHNAIEFISVVE